MNLRFLLARLDKLQYLDYALVDSNEAVQAREQYQDELEEMKEVKAIEDAALTREVEQIKYLAVLKDANTLLTDMFKEDTEMNKIEALPGLRSIIDDYNEEAKAATEDVAVVLLEKHSALSREVDEFREKYERVQLISSMEVSIEAVGAEAREIATEHFRIVGVLENNFFENVSQLAVTLLERMASEDGEEDDFLTDECRAILNDRDALNNAINGSHDIHIGKLLAQEDVMREQSLAKVADVIKSARDWEWTRNRSRIAEVIHIKEKHLGEIGKVRDELNRVDDEFY